MKSKKWYPIFQEKRDEMNCRPLQYVKARAEARYRFEGWKERRFDQKYNAVLRQGREPFFYINRRVAIYYGMISP